MQDLNAWSVGWIDWNLVLDFTGGPNHLGNVCDSPVLCNEDWSDVIFQPYLHVIGHFSKYIVPGSKRVAFDLQTTFVGETDGGDSGARDGYELSFYSCDKSSRQKWVYNPTHQQL